MLLLRLLTALEGLHPRGLVLNRSQLAARPQFAGREIKLFRNERVGAYC